jgi:multiple sugar transport system substrate-binding protein
MKTYLLIFSIVAIVAIVSLILIIFYFNPLPILSREEPQPVQLYFADHISVALDLVIRKFNEKYKGWIEVIPVDLPFNKFSTNERKELLARSLRSKSGRLDLFSIDHIWVPRFAKWSEPLDEYFSPAERAEILPYAFSSCSYDSVLVSVPLYIDIGMMYYRRDIIERLPDAGQIEEKLKKSITWDEMLHLRDRLQYRGKPFYIFQANDYEGLVCNYFELLAGRDKQMFARNTIDLHSPTARAALQQMVDFVNKDNISPARVVELDENSSYRYMLDHDAVFVRGWPNFIENFRKMYPDTVKVNHLGRAALPHFPGQEPTSVYGGWNIMLSKYSTKKKEALEFVKFLQTIEIQELLFEVGGYIPVNNAVYADSQYMSRRPELAYYRQLLDHGFHRPSLIEYTKISDIISHYVHRAISNELSVDEALNKASEMISSNKVLIK